MPSKNLTTSVYPTGHRGYVLAGKLQPYHLVQSEKPRMQTLAPDTGAERRRHSYTLPEMPSPQVHITPPAFQVGEETSHCSVIASISVHIAALAHPVPAYICSMGGSTYRHTPNTCSRQDILGHVCNHSWERMCRQGPWPI